jgi:acetolactate synthase I/II/III large subunit
MVTQWQSLFFHDRFAHTHQRNPDFVKLAEAMHVKARRTTKLETLKEDLQWLIDGSGDGPAFLEVVVDQKVPVLPMVPGGSALHEFLVYDEKKEKERRQRTRERSGR